MTSLTDLGYETAEVLVRPARGDRQAQHLTVRGLSAFDVMRLVKIHGGGIMAVFDAVKSQKLALDLNNTATLASLMLDQAPDIVADIIVVASDSTDVLADFEIAKKLPIKAQLSALEKIAELTFVDGTPGEFLETVVRMMGGINGLLRESLPKSVKDAVAKAVAAQSPQTAN